MAIAYNTSGTGTYASPGTSGSFAANVGSGTDRILWNSNVTDAGATDVTTSITYNGVSLTKLVGRRLNTSSQHVALWYLINPTSGSNTFAWTGSASCYSYSAWSVYTGVPSGVGGVGSNTDSQDVASGTLTLTLTTQYDNAWLISGSRSTDTGDQNAGTGTTRRQQLASAIGDSNGAKTPTGSYSMAWSANPSGKIGGVMGHFYPSAASAVNSNFLSFM